MADLFWLYWDASVRFALLSALLLLFLPLLRRWLSPKALCWAWALLLLRLSLPLALPFSGSIFNVSEKLQPSTWTHALRSGVVEAGWGETVLPVFRTQDDLAKSTLVGFSWENALVLLWLLGFLVLLGHLLLNAVRLHLFFRRSVRQNGGRLYEIFKDTRRRFGVHANVPLLVSSDIKTPGIAGIFNPRVVIPKFCKEELSDDEVRCVLLHELTHYKRGDLFLHHLLLLICFIHWYNPLVWLVFRQFKVSMEQACDQDVVETVSITTVRDYGMTLLRVMQRSRRALVSPAGALCLLGNRRSSALRDRIQLITTPRRSVPALAAIGVCLFSASFVYSITGESKVENEAERLLSLTSFPGSSIFLKASGASEKREEIALAFDASTSLSPQSWVHEIDVSEFQGREVIVRVTYKVVPGREGEEFWVVVRNGEGEVTHTRTTTNASRAGSQSRVMEIRLWLEEGATEIDCGLSSREDSLAGLTAFELLEARP